MKLDAFKCDVTGEEVTGKRGDSVVVDIGANLRLVVTAQARESDKHGFVQGDIGPKAAAEIAAALKGAAARLQGEK